MMGSDLSKKKSEGLPKAPPFESREWEPDDCCVGEMQRGYAFGPPLNPFALDLRSYEGMQGIFVIAGTASEDVCRYCKRHASEWQLIDVVNEMTTVLCLRSLPHSILVGSGILPHSTFSLASLVPARRKQWYHVPDTGQQRAMLAVVNHLYEEFGDARVYMALRWLPRPRLLYCLSQDEADDLKTQVENTHPGLIAESLAAHPEVATYYKLPSQRTMPSDYGRSLKIWLRDTLATIVTSECTDEHCLIHKKRMREKEDDPTAKRANPDVI